MVLVCGSMTKTWVLPISEVFDLFLDKISMAFAACFLIHSSEQKIHPSFGSLSQQKQVFFLTTTWNKKTTIYYIFINWHKWYHRKGLKYIIYYPKMNLIYNWSKYFLNFLPTYPRYSFMLYIYLISRFWSWRNLNVEHLFWNPNIFFSTDLKFAIGPRKLWQ